MRRAVGVAQRHRERIGGVVGRGQLGQIEQRLHHARHLVLVRTPVSADRGLDLLRGVARAGQPVAPGGEHHHAARMAHGEGGAHVLPEVELLEGHRVGGVLLQQTLHAGVDIDQAPLDRQCRHASR